MVIITVKQTKKCITVLIKCRQFNQSSYAQKVKCDVVNIECIRYKVVNIFTAELL